MEKQCDKYCEDRFKEVEYRMNEMEKSQIGTDILVKQFMETSKELSATMKNVERTMIEMQISLKENNKDIAEMNCKIDKLDNKVQCESDKNLIDIRDVQKNGAMSNLTKYGIGAVGLAGVYGLIEIVGKIMEVVKK